MPFSGYLRAQLGLQGIGPSYSDEAYHLYSATTLSLLPVATRLLSDSAKAAPLWSGEARASEAKAFTRFRGPGITSGA